MKKKLLLTLAVVGGSLLICIGIYFIADSIHRKKVSQTQSLPGAGSAIVYPGNTMPGQMTYDKPVIYYYPETETKISTIIDLDGTLTCTYPAYNDGFLVTAMPDGTLYDENGMQYSYLYWEGETDFEFDFSKGFCIKGSETASFLEDALEKLGLNRKEANEFIVYWLPIMQENAYNIITFAGADYDETAKLIIDPSPDTLIRVMMGFKASDTEVEIEPQELTAPERKGFVVVEWGGSEAN